MTSFPTPSDRQRISRAGGTDPQWRGDGKELYYVSSDGTLVAVPIAPGVDFRHGSPEPLFRITPDPLSLRWGFVYAAALDGQRFLVAEAIGPAQPQLIVKLNWVAGRP